MVTLLNRVKYVEQELAKKRGRNIENIDQVENELNRAEDELYKIPEHLKVNCNYFDAFRHLNLHFVFGS